MKYMQYAEDEVDDQHIINSGFDLFKFIEQMELRYIYNVRIGKINMVRIVPGFNFTNYDIVKDAEMYFVYMVDGLPNPLYSGKTEDINKCRRFKNVKEVKATLFKEFSKYL